MKVRITMPDRESEVLGDIKNLYIEMQQLPRVNDVVQYGNESYVVKRVRWILDQPNIDAAMTLGGRVMR